MHLMLQKMKKEMIFMSKIFKPFLLLFKGIYTIIDKCLVTPISRFIYYLTEKLKNNPIHIEKFFNRPVTLVYVSLFLAVITFFLVDSQVITLVETQAEILTNEPVTVIYNKEAYVVEGAVDTADIILTGKKSALYLA